MTREEKAFKRMFGKHSPEQPQRENQPTRTMRCTLSCGNADLLWQRKYGVWFLMAVSKGFAKHFRHAPITGQGFKLWAKRTKLIRSWLPQQTAVNLQFFAD